MYIWHLQGTISARVKVSAQPDFYWGSLSSAPTQRGQVMLARVGSGITTKPRKTKVGRHKTRLWLLGDYDDDGGALSKTIKQGCQSIYIPNITLLWMWLSWCSQPSIKTKLEGRSLLCERSHVRGKVLLVICGIDKNVKAKYRYIYNYVQQKQWKTLLTMEQVQLKHQILFWGAQKRHRLHRCDSCLWRWRASGGTQGDPCNLQPFLLKTFEEEQQ